MMRMDVEEEHSGGGGSVGGGGADDDPRYEVEGEEEEGDDEHDSPRTILIKANIAKVRGGGREKGRSRGV